LVGFMDEAFADAYLQNSCEGAGATAPDRKQFWTAARNKLGAPSANAGHPDIQALPPTAKPHLRRVEQLNPRFQQAISKLKWSFKSVEIDPLLCYQFHVDTDRAQRACSSAKTKPPTPGELLQTCLPLSPAKLRHQVSALGDSGLFVRSDDLNVRLLDAKAGATKGETWTATIVWGTATPLVSVVNFGGRYILHNGYHRAYGLRVAGATHVPCLVLEANAWNDFVDPKSQVFAEALLNSADPPTLAHFTQGRATPVRLRSVTRVIQISLAELGLPDHYQ